MHKGLVAAVALLVASGVCSAQASPAPKGGGAYRRLDPKKLTDTLRGLGMTELIEEHLAQQQASGGTAPVAGDMAALAEQKIKDAEASNDLGRRDALLAEAVGLYRTLAGKTPVTEEDRWNSFNYRLRLADTVRIRIEPAVLRLMFLQGAEEDRTTIAEQTAEPVKTLNNLSRDVADTLVAYRTDPNKRNFVLFQRRSEDTLEILEGITIWLKLDRGLALNAAVPAESGERTTLLNDVITATRKHIASTEDPSAQYRPYLLMGMATRELGKYDDAVVPLGKAADPKAPPGINLQARFEMARNQIESGRFDAAPAGIEDFKTQALAVVGAEGRKDVDGLAAFLTNYLYETKAARSADANAARADRLAAQKALVDYLDKYDDPNVQAEFLQCVGFKYRDRKDYSNLGAIVLVAVAKGERGRGTDAGAAEAVRLLDLAADPNDPTSAAAAPYALWESAGLLFDLKRPLESSRRFTALAQRFPARKEAFRAALNGVIACYLAVQAAQKDGTYDAALRDEFIQSLETVLGRWGDRPQAAPWFYNLGDAYAEKARAADAKARRTVLLKAAEAFEKTPANLPESRDGRRKALEMRIQLLEEDPKAADARPQAQALFDKLNAFAADARKALASEKDPDTIRECTEWGARAAFEAVQVRFRYLQEPDAALRDLRGVLEDWKDSSITREMIEWGIRVKVQTNRITEAITEVEAYRQKYPKEAEGVLRQVNQGIEKRIKELRRDPQGGGEELVGLLKAYPVFSKELFDRAVRGDPNQAYVARQMYADALWQAGEGAKSLELWEQCVAEDSRRAEASNKVVEEEVSQRLQAVAEAGRDPAKLKRLAQEYEKLLAARNLPTDTAHGRGVRLSVRALDQADANRLDEWAADLERRLSAALKGVATAWKSRLQADAVNIQGLARVYALLGRTKDAAEKYGQLIRGVDRTAFGEFYWDVQLEFCEFTLEAYRKDKNQMGSLRTYLLQLRGEDAKMGGKAPLFDQIDAEAKKASE